MPLTKATQNVIEPFTQPTTFVVNSASDAVRITQTGTGNALSVEDSTNPDATPFVVDTNGSVGIGTSTPTTKLHVESTGFSGARALFRSVDSGNYITIQGADGVGINDSAFINLEDGDLTHGAFISLTGQATGSSGDMRFYTGGNAGGTRMIITQEGNVAIGNIDPVYLLQLATDSAAKPSTNTWTIASDERVKENIKPFTKGLDAINSINPVIYDYNGNAGFEKIKNNVGVIAQEIKDIVPEGISTFEAKLNENDSEKTELYNFNSHALTYILINAVKELSAKVAELEAK